MMRPPMRNASEGFVLGADLSSQNDLLADMSALDCHGSNGTDRRGIGFGTWLATAEHESQGPAKASRAQSNCERM